MWKLKAQYPSKHSKLYVYFSESLSKHFCNDKPQTANAKLRCLGDWKGNSATSWMRIFQALKFWEKALRLWNPLLSFQRWVGTPGPSLFIFSSNATHRCMPAGILFQTTENVTLPEQQALIQNVLTPRRSILPAEVCLWRTFWFTDGEETVAFTLVSWTLCTVSTSVSLTGNSLNKTSMNSNGKKTTFVARQRSKWCC